MHEGVHGGCASVVTGGFVVFERIGFSDLELPPLRTKNPGNAWVFRLVGLVPSFRIEGSIARPSREPATFREHRGGLSILSLGDFKGVEPEKWDRE